MPTTALRPETEHGPTSSAISLRHCILLVGVLLTMLVAFELATRVFVRRISNIEGRIGREYSASVAPPADSRPVMLFVGNSLLDKAVDFDRLREALAPKFEARRFVVEQTYYYDWQYGIRKLFEQGARPTVLVLMLNAYQWASTTSRGEYAAHLLVSHSDILSFTHDLGLHPTNAASMVFANYSMMYGVRSEIRKAVLGRLMPDLPALTNRLTIAPSLPIPDSTLRSAVRARTGVLREECIKHNVKLLLAVPPALTHHPLEVIQQAAKEAGVEALLPFAAGDFTVTDYSDGFHLNETGAARFTQQITSSLRRSETVQWQ